MSKKKTLKVLLTTAIVFSSTVAPTLADAETKGLNTKQQKAEKMHDYLMWYGSNKSAAAATYDLSNKKSIVKNGAVYDKWLVSKDYENFQTAWKALSSTEKTVAAMKTVSKEHQAADTYLAATKSIFTYYNAVKDNANVIATTGTGLEDYLSKDKGLRKAALEQYTKFRDVSGESFKEGERRYYANKKYISTVDFLQGSQKLVEARAAILTVQNEQDIENIETMLVAAQEKSKAIGNYSATFVNELTNEIARIEKQLQSIELPGLSMNQRTVLKEHQNLMLYGSNTPGKETYDFRKTTSIVKKAGVYAKWLASNDYNNFHAAWALLTAEEKKAPEMQQVYNEYQNAKAYLKASDAIFAYYDEAKNNATTIASKGEMVDTLLNSDSGLRQKALASYKDFYTTTGEQKVEKSRRDYLNKKYLSVVSFLNGSKSLATGRTNIINATKPEQVDPYYTSAETKVKGYITEIGNYSQTYVTSLQDALASLKKAATSRKKDFIYAVGKVNSNGTIVLTSAEYTSFSAANSKFGNNEVLVKRDKLKDTNQVLKANKGIVSVASTTATVFGNSNLTNSKTYNAKGVELKYIETVSEDVVKVQIADTVGYMKMNESSIIPSSMVVGHSYYMNKGGKLYHYIYNQANKNLSGGYVIGEEVGSLKENTKYYSLNGVDFYNANGTKITSLNKNNLYQFMDATTKNTKFTAAHIDAYLKAVKPDSPIIGEGKSFIEAGEKYGINPILLFSLANHESNYGTSAIAKQKKNLFGINAIDSDPMGGATTYKTYKESILRAAEFLTTGYMNPNDWRYEGKFFGNKSVGFNVRYASDPFWGQKVAGHYYRFEQWVKTNGKMVEPTIPESPVEELKVEVGNEEEEMIETPVEPDVSENVVESDNVEVEVAE